MAIYFLTDTHLGAGYISDPVGHQRQVIAMLRQIEPDAEAIYLLGDIIDFWFEYRNVIPRGYTLFLAELARLTARGISVYWMHGNHDMWTGKCLETEFGITVIQDTFYNIMLPHQTVMITHGDMIGRVPLSYRALRSLFRSKFCRHMLAMIHPRITMMVAHGWSTHSRKNGGYAPEPDREALVRWASHYLDTHPTIPPTRYIIAGHIHCDRRIAIPKHEAELILVGDGYKLFSYARLEDGNLKIEHFESSI